jgi:hypothetical protein
VQQVLEKLRKAQLNSPSLSLSLSRTHLKIEMRI